MKGIVKNWRLAFSFQSAGAHCTVRRHGLLEADKRELRLLPSSPECCQTRKFRSDPLRIRTLLCLTANWSIEDPNTSLSYSECGRRIERNSRGDYWNVDKAERVNDSLIWSFNCHLRRPLLPLLHGSASLGTPWQKFCGVVNIQRRCRYFSYF